MVQNTQFTQVSTQVSTPHDIGHGLPSTYQEDFFFDTTDPNILRKGSFPSEPADYGALKMHCGQQWWG
jgi:hypothetical protein